MKETERAIYLGYCLRAREGNIYTVVDRVVGREILGTRQYREEER